MSGHFVHNIGGVSADAILDIVFIHGLSGDPTKTWQYNGADTFWPQWLKDDLPNVNVWSIEYPSSVFTKIFKGPGLSISENASALIEALIAENIGHRSLVFICHSLGGLVAKAIFARCVDSQDTGWRRIGHRVVGIAFVATPHDGASLANLAGVIPATSKAISELRNNDEAIQELGRRYRNLCHDRNLRTKVYCESQKIGGHLIVSKSSADPKAPGSEPVTIDADHIDICKPKSKDELLYKSMRSFLSDMLSTDTDQNLNSNLMSDYERFTTKEDPEERLDLADKLRLGKREHLIKDARAGEERFAKRLTRNILQTAANRKYVDILSELKVRFNKIVKPRINDGTLSQQKIDEAVTDKVIEPVTQKYKADETVALNYETADDALYYLTGKCHIRWDDGKN